METFTQPRIRRALTVALVCLISPWPLIAQEHSHGVPVRGAEAVRAVPVGPAVLANVSRVPHTVEVTITAEPTRLSIVPGHSTDSYAFNGRVPGPTLDVYEGDKVIVHFHNRLSEATAFTGMVCTSRPLRMEAPTIRWRRAEVTTTSSRPSAGRRGRTGIILTRVIRPANKSAKGLFGAVIVRARDDPLRSLPEKLIILADNRFRPDGSIDFPDPNSFAGKMDQENGRECSTMFVNGQVMPKIRIRSGEVQRWRIVNASAARVYRLAIPGQTLIHVGNDGGLFEHPVEVKDILVANSERVEVLVRGTGAPGTRAVLQTLPYDRYVPQTRPKEWNVAHDLLSLEYTKQKPVAPVAIPAVLRPIPAIDTTLATVRRVFVLQQGFINGKLHDMNRIDEKAKLGAVEIWEIDNVVGMDHPFHLHGFQFQVIDRDGVPEPFRSWKDTINVPKHSTARFIVRFADFAGKWMYHCHILDHEDHGMMGVVEVQ